MAPPADANEANTAQIQRQSTIAEWALLLQRHEAALARGDVRTATALAKGMETLLDETFGQAFATDPSADVGYLFYLSELAHAEALRADGMENVSAEEFFAAFRLLEKDGRSSALARGRGALVVARNFASAGQVAPAQDWFERANALLRDGNANPVEIGNALNEQAVHLAQIGQPRAAEGKLLRAIALMSEGPEPGLRVAAGLTNLALLYRQEGHPETAQSLMERAVLLTRGAAGEWNEKYAQRLSVLASLQAELGQMAEAEETWISAIGVTEKIGAAGTPVLAWRLRQLADVLEARGKSRHAAAVNDRVAVIMGNVSLKDVRIVDFTMATE